MGRHGIRPIGFVLHLGLMATSCTAGRDSGAFDVVATIDAGLNPHQIVFDDGRVYIAAAGSDYVTVVDDASFAVVDSLSVPDAPLGVARLDDGDLAVTRFGADEVVRVDPRTGRTTDRVETGGAPSLLVGPEPGGYHYVSVEQANRVWRLHTADFTLDGFIETGSRPFPPSFTRDGRLLFIPNYDDGTVTVYDVWNERIVATTPVGERPSGGVVFPEDDVYAVAVRGENRIVLINTASFDVVGTIDEGIGDSPFSVVLTPHGRLAFVNNTASHDISVIDVDTRTVITRLPVGEQPIVMAVHPNGETLWVSSEGSDEVTVLDIPEDWRAPRALPVADAPAQVAVLGMIHGRHPSSALWGFEQLEYTVRSFDPDIVCAEIPPNRWERTWRDYVERGVVEDSRVVRFPEYNDFMLRLAREMEFDIVPCAAWTQEMSELRARRLEEYATAPALAARSAEYRAARSAARDAFPDPADADDPHYIHSAAYDARTKAEYAVYDAYQNDWIGPGGWTNINVAHMELIDRTIRRHPGKRILVTFGAGHKYWFLEALANRDDVEVVDIVPHLPPR